MMQRTDFKGASSLLQPGFYWLFLLLIIIITYPPSQLLRSENAVTWLKKVRQVKKHKGSDY